MFAPHHACLQSWCVIDSWVAAFSCFSDMHSAWNFQNFHVTIRSGVSFCWWLGAVPIWTCCPHRIGHRQTLSSLYHPGFASTVNSNSPLQPSATSEDEKLRIPELRGWHITLTDLLNLTIFNPKSLGLTPDLGVSRLHQLQKETSWSSRTSSQFQATGMHFVSYGSATCYAAESFHIHLCNLPILGW